MKCSGPFTWIARLALGVALIISIYLAWTSLAGSEVAGCSAEGSGCNAVLSSRWGSVFGLPVSLMGLPIYGALLVLSWHQSPRGQTILNSLSLTVVGAALWFGAVQMFVLHAFCPWCCTTHGFALTGVLLLWLTRVSRESGHRWSTLPWAVALPCLLTMIALQTFGPAPAETVNRTLGSTGGAVIDADRNVTLHGGRFVLTPSSLPNIGTPQATKHAVALTDYTCGYCRKLHLQLDRAVAAYQPGSISVIELPVARDATAAEIQRLMLSIWRLDPRAKTTLELQIFNGQLAVDPKAIRAAAEKLLGAEQVATALATYGEWADEQIALASAILEANREVTGVAHLPQLIVGEEVNIGASSDLDLYLGLFEAHLDLERPDDESLALAATTPPRSGPRAQPRGPAFIPGSPSRVVRAAGGAPPAETKIPAGYFSWMLDHFAMPDEISLAAPNQNPDFDDDRNSLEYWCRQNPRLRDSGKSGLPQRDSEGRLTFTLQLRDDDPDLEGYIEFADDLHFAGQFHRQIPFSSLTPSDPDPGDGLVSWFAADPELARAQRFVRALVEIPWPQDLACVADCAHVAVRTCESDPLRLREFFHMCLDTCQQGRCEGATALVCGCDGVTYQTACEAARARVGVEHIGACGSPPCNSNADCGAADYCEFESGCTGPGMCTARPVFCPENFDPVCGCDGRTYGNACEAAAAGVNVAHIGACPPPPCSSNADCDAADYCEFDSGCTGPGTCKVRPRVCPLVFDPVCGCDGATYGNACNAAAAGINVSAQGACQRARIPNP